METVVLSKLEWETLRESYQRRQASLVVLRSLITKEMDCKDPIAKMCETCTFLQSLLDIIDAVDPHKENENGENDSEVGMG